MGSEANGSLANQGLRLEVHLVERHVFMRLTDLGAGTVVADGEYLYRAEKGDGNGTLVAQRLESPQLRLNEDRLELTGTLAGLHLTQVFRAATGGRMVEERIAIHNGGSRTVSLERFTASMTRLVTDHLGIVLPELRADRLAAIPYRSRVDLSFADLLERQGWEHRVARESFTKLTSPEIGISPGPQRASEAWAWLRGDRAFVISKFNQAGMEFSTIAVEPAEEGVLLRFGGAGTHAGDPSALRAIAPRATVELGVTRYESIAGGYEQAAYAFRQFLDAQGCRFPPGFNPPVHWNELYDTPEWNLASPGSPPGKRMTRPVAYTRELMEGEAEKAVQYGCQALYLDPGWDTDFGTFLWGESWLGPRRTFVEDMRTRYNLGVSLHCPLSTWMSTDGRAVPSWPRDSWRMRQDGTVAEGAVCLGSRPYLDEASRRLGEHCDDGVVFLMFDGNGWNGGCWNPSHGHPVPYTKEDHVRANVELARRIHDRNPDVIIEMHDPIADAILWSLQSRSLATGGRLRTEEAVPRYTPAYYKYGLPGSHNEIWGFELMWQCMEDIRDGRARSLYYHDLGCNVPVYLHIDLRDDNEHCLVLWWYASTCRHLGMGGTHSVPAVAEAQKRSMRTYRGLERYYKHGDFYGMHEEAHVHVLPAEGAFVVNLFNLSADDRIVEGSISMVQMGLDPDRYYITPKGGAFDRARGTFSIRRRMAPWSADVVEVRSVVTENGGRAAGGP